MRNLWLRPNINFNLILLSESLLSEYLTIITYTMQNLSSKLNQPQLEAVEYVSGALLVIAGAGSGKTRVITEKIAHLIAKCGYAARNITAITFTNKAAREMRERVAKVIHGIDTRGLTITTFHSLGLKILKEEAHHLGYKTNFSILDSYDSSKIVSDHLKTTDKSLVKSLQHQISLWKNSFATPEYLLSIAKDNLEVANIRIYEQYQDTLRAYQAVDFDDLILLPIYLFKQNLDVLYKWQQKIQYLLIDEYQDTNESQYTLIKLLCQRSQLFTAVGDDDQSIYGWRGAKVENIHNLHDDFKHLKVVKLEQNYRSSNTILAAANSVIQNNQTLFVKKLWSEFGQGEAIRIMSCKNDEAEAELIVRKIMLHHSLNGSKFSDYAVLYRSNHQARILEQTLRNYQVPYTISGGQSFFDKSEIKDIGAYLRLLVNDDDDIAFIRAVTTPKRGIGHVTLDKLTGYSKQRGISLFAALWEEGFASNCAHTQLEELINFGNFINELQAKMKTTAVGELLNELVAKIQYEEYLYEHETMSSAEKKWGNVLQFITWLDKKATNDNKHIPELVQMLTLISLLDGKNEDEVDAVNLSTLHAAKGLEYPYVYLTSCEEGIIPHQESINSDIIDEERRLMYVGITRAQKELTLSYCQQRKTGGEIKTMERSRFIDEMGELNIIDEAIAKHEKIADNDELHLRLQQLKSLLR